jgi:sigma-B regulation protein RsbU (phosphoserine phosphatase)
MDGALIFIADDQPDILTALRLLLKGQGYAIVSFDSPESLLQASIEQPPNLILMDLNYTRDTTSGQEGLDLLTRLENLPTPAPIVVMTAWGSIELAVEAMRRGARDFVLKPWDNARLLEVVRRHLRPVVPASDALARDLAIARQVQSQLLPQRVPVLRGLRLDGHCRQAGLVGGDSYDFIDLGDGRIVLTLADISGKGVAAALLMSNLQASLRAMLHRVPLSLETSLQELNRQFYESTAPEQYATLFIALYDDSARLLSYANCGHPAPLVLRAAGGVERLESTAPILGILPELPIDVAEIRLEPGDTLAVYSDGATEPWDEGDQVLFELLRSEPHGSASEFTARLASGQAQQADDITLVLARAF